VVANCGDSRLITDHATGGTHFHAITTDHRPSEPSEAVRLAECCKRGHGHLSCQRWTPATTNQGELQWLHSPVERLFPGGLAVSRTIGDTSCCKSAVPVPDVYRIFLGSAISVPPATIPAVNIASPNRRALMMSSAKASTFAGSRRSVMSACTASSADSTGVGHGRTHRFVLATDGLWDILSIQEVGVLAARHGHGAHDDEHDVLAEEVPTHVSAARIMEECLAKCKEVGHYDDISILVIDVTV
jgi:serine/threonine protein phosphatase PrpC